MRGDAIIGHTDSHPHSATHTGALAYHLHNPDFVGVGNRERLAAAVITVFLYEFRHYLDGFAGGTGTLQTEINQTSVIDDTGSIHQFGTAAEGCLADSKLEFIHITDDVVGLARLFYPAEVLAGVPLVHINPCTLLVHACGIMV